MCNVIKEFRGKYSFLSNFYECSVTYKGLTFLNSEAAFQAQKTLDENVKKTFCNLSPKEAKRKGRQVQLRADWEKIKDTLMCEIIIAKFSQNEELLQKLINTNDEYLQEGNNWNDTYWGVCRGKGKNMLGRILMAIRKEIRINAQRKEI